MGIRCHTPSETDLRSYDFALTGSLDRESAPDIRKILLEEALRHREVRIDVFGLELIDHAGLAILVEAYAAARRAGVEMVFHRPSESLRRVLRFTRLDQVLPISDSPACPRLKETARLCRGGRFTMEGVLGQRLTTA
jgi:anti-anti-sigma factor